MAAALLSAHGLGAGLFTSPAPRPVEQRFEVGGIRDAPRTSSPKRSTTLAPFVDLYEERTGDGITYFELTAALAFSWFADRTVDAAVRRDRSRGAGSTPPTPPHPRWRWSPTSLSSTPSISGTTIAAIAAEKVAILDPGAVLVTGDLPPEAADGGRGQGAAEHGARWFRFGARLPGGRRVADSRARLAVRPRRGSTAVPRTATCRMRGRHQVGQLRRGGGGGRGALRPSSRRGGGSARRRPALLPRAVWRCSARPSGALRRGSQPGRDGGAGGGACARSSPSISLDGGVRGDAPTRTCRPCSATSVTPVAVVHTASADSPRADARRSRWPPWSPRRSACPVTAHDSVAAALRRGAGGRWAGAGHRVAVRGGGGREQRWEWVLSS